MLPPISECPSAGTKHVRHAFPKDVVHQERRKEVEPSFLPGDLVRVLLVRQRLHDEVQAVVVLRKLRKIGRRSSP